MEDPPLLEAILRWCEAAAPAPWYPKLHAEQQGIPRDSLDIPLADLRLGGWIELTDWIKDQGQGYRLTADGKELLANSAAMAGVRAGVLPVMAKPEPAAENQEEEAALDAVTPDETPPTVRNVLVIVSTVFFIGGLATASKAGLGEDYMAGVNIGKLLDELGALRGQFLLDGQWWRLITSCFIHSGWEHLAGNMLLLYIIGGVAERMWGHWRFLTLYLLSGLGGSCFMAAWEPQVRVVGASGAVLGVFAGQVVWLVLNRQHLPADLVALWLRSVAIMAVIMIWMSTRDHVAGLAHLGGAATGALTAYCIQYQRFGTRWQIGLSCVGLAALPVGLIGLVLIAMDTTADWDALRRRSGRLIQIARRDFDCRERRRGLDFTPTPRPRFPFARGKDAADLA